MAFVNGRDKQRRCVKRAMCRSECNSGERVCQRIQRVSNRANVS